MVLTLSEEEHDYLLRILEQFHLELFNEIAHTDYREFRQGLLKNEKLLENLIFRLQETTVQKTAS